MPADAADTADKRRCRRHDGSARDAGHGRARRGIAPGERIVRQERRLFLHGAGLVGRATLHAVAVLVEAHVLRVAGVAVAEQRPLQPVGVAAGQQRQAAADEHRRNGDDRDRALERDLASGFAAHAHIAQQLRPRLIEEQQHRRRDEALDQADGQMDRLHNGAERAERQIRDAGERRLQHDRERAELQRQHAAEHGRKRDLEAVRRPLAAPRKAAAAHQRPVNEKISDEAAVKRHVPDVCAQRQQTAVGKEQALDREDHDHGQKSCPRPEYGREQQAAAQMAGRAGAGDGVVDHLPREHERRHDGHGRQLFGR